MKVYQTTDEGPRLIGRADVDDGGLPYLEVSLFGASSTIMDRFAFSAVTYLPLGGDAPVSGRVLLLSPLQRPEILPGWQPFAS